MKITLLHNPTAGEESYTKKKLCSLLEKAGHDVTYQSVKEKGYKDIYKEPAELFLAAGGDGTVRRVAQQSISHGVPFSVLPTGTNNFFAEALGLPSKPEKWIPRLGEVTPVEFDAGVVKGPWGEVKFVMGCGFGLFPKCLRLVERRKKEGRNVELRSLLREKAPKAKAEYNQVILDGKDISGKYFLLEVMNIHAMAPGLAFCPAAKPSDGYLHLVVAGEDDRPAVMDALRKESDTIPFSLPVHRFQSLTLGVPDSLAHIDDRLRPKTDDELPTQGHIEIKVLPAAIKVLAP